MIVEPGFHCELYVKTEAQTQSNRTGGVKAAASRSAIALPTRCVVCVDKGAHKSLVTRLLDAVAAHVHVCSALC